MTGFISTVAFGLKPRPTRPRHNPSGIITFRRITPRSSSHPTYGGDDDVWLHQIYREYR
ncbi:hypothetical protein [Marinomonas pollencensis]|uniref:hypothetical protein n=1 Tax=Marinomonas pollencensis TaxID=491954 RepID=UPI0015F28532|nr:hypothetical protein [Marinomonas pollencensis]